MPDWKPSLGQVALLELDAGGDDCLTGVVLRVDEGVVVIDLGASPKPAGSQADVTASFFDPDALYRVTATVVPHDGSKTVIDLTVRNVERVQRRLAARTKLTVPVALSNLDDAGPEGTGMEFVSVAGESIDVGEGGCRVLVNGPFPAGCDPTVTMHLDDDTTLVALAAVLEEQARPDGSFEYRLVFIDQDDGHREQLARFLDT